MSASAFTSFSRETSFLSRQSSYKFGANGATTGAYQKTSEFSLDFLNTDDKDAIAELQYINSFCKQFRTFSNLQKKQFLTKYLNSCQDDAIKELHLYLEPLEHRDFCIHAQSEYPAWVQLDERRRIVFSRPIDSQRKSTRPTSKAVKNTGLKSDFKRMSTAARRMGTGQRMTTAAYGRASAVTSGLRSAMSIKTPFTPQQATRTPSFSLLIRSNSILNSMMNGDVPLIPFSSSAKTFVTSKKSARKFDLTNVVVPPDPPVKYSIDNFLRDKSQSLFRRQWNLDSELFKTRAAKNTDSMIEKLKAIFVQHYESKAEPRPKTKATVAKTPSKKSTFKDGAKNELNRLGKSRRTSVSSSYKIQNTLVKENSNIIIEEDDVDQQQSVYLKKLQNNFYNRKLWNSLEFMSKPQEMNLFPETEREYTNEYSVLQRYDWTQSTFGKSLSKFKVIPAIPPESHREPTFDSSGSDIDDSVDFPRSPSGARTRSRERKRHEFIIISERCLNEIKNWTSMRKITLLASLLKYCPNFVLLFIRDMVNEKLHSNRKNIDCLPDNMLLKVFRLLDKNSLDEVANVCQRWNYLANTNELWIWKCKMLGKQEKLFQVEKIIYDELQEDEDIDWRLAFSELEEFVTKLKSEYYKKLVEDFEKQRLGDKTLSTVTRFSESSAFSNNRLRSGLTTIMSEQPSSRRSSISSPKPLTRSRTQNYINFYALPKKVKKKKKDESKERSTSRSSSSLQQPQPQQSQSAVSASSDTSSTRRASVTFDPNLVKSLNIDSSDQSGDDESKKSKIKMETKKPSPTTDAVVPCDVQEEFEEKKMELKQSRDLLGKIMPNYRLRWRLEDEDDDDLKNTEKVLFNVKPITQVRNLRNHSDKVACMDYDKRRLITGSMDRTIVVYDIRNGQFLKKLKGHKGGIRCLQLLANRLCSGSWDCTIRIWNLITFQLVHTIFDSDGSFSCLDFDFKYLIAGSHDKSIRVWTFDEQFKEDNYPPKEPVNEDSDTRVIHFQRKIELHQAPITALKYDGIKCIVSANSSGSILLIDIDGTLLHELSHHKFLEPIICLKLVGALVVCSTKTGKLMFWNRFNNECEAVIQCHQVAVNALAFFDGRFYTGGDDGILKEWDLKTFTCLREIKAHNGPVFGVDVGEIRIVTCGADKLARIWEMTTPINKMPREALQ